MYTVSTTVTNVSPKARRHPKPEYGKKLEDRRKELGRSQESIADYTQGRLYKHWLYRLENGREKKPSDLKPEEIKMLAGFLNWSPHQLADVLGLVLPTSEFGLDPRMERYTATDEQVEVYPVYQSASAGDSDPDIDEDDVAVLPTSVRIAHGVDRANVFPVKVNGNCMVSHGVRGSKRNIAHGDYVFADTGRAPINGDIILCFDAQEDKLIIKFYQEEADDDGYVILYPASGVPVVRPKEDPQLRLRGVVFARSGGVK